MLPITYERPAALLLILGGALACFAGRRLFRTVLAIYGFLLGAMLASSVMGITNTAGMVAAAIVGGLLGAGILVFAYFVGIAIAGAALGAFALHVGYGYFRPGDPPAVAVIAMAVCGALAAMVLQRYVIVVVTAFAGAWTVLVGGLALAGDAAVLRGTSAGDVWILYPMGAAAGRPWVPVAWIVLGLVGTGLQLSTKGRKR
ncbi:MAG: DUF4203 domain-containing protein [Acidobacteriota bacterium]